MPSFDPLSKSSFLTLAVAAGLTAALAVTPARAETPDVLEQPSRTFAGAFLAANAARSEHDFGAAARFFDQALRYDPSNISLKRDLLVSLITDGQIEAAVPYAQKLRDENDVERIARLVLGVDAIADGRFDDAQPLLILRVENDLERLLTGVLRAWAHQGNGNTDRALAMIDDLRGPEWFGLFTAYHGALIADAAQMSDEADRRFAAAMNDQTGGSASPLTYLRLADAYARQLLRDGRPDDARQIIDRALVTAPNNPDLLSLRDGLDTPQAAVNQISTARAGSAEILLNLGSAINRDGAEDFAALYLELGRSLHSDSAQILFELGGIAERLQQPQKAIRHYAAVPDEAPLARIASLQRAIALSDLDRNDEAKATLRQLIDQQPDDFRGYLALGSIHASLREFDEAATTYEEAMANVDLDHPRFWQMHYRLGIAYERTDRWPEAERTFQHTLTLSPDQPDVLNYLGYSWIDMNMHLDEGIEMIRTAVEQRPNDGYIVDSLGWAYYRLGDFENAVEHLERASDLRPSDAIINDHLGDAYWRVGRYLEATYQWSRVLTMDGEDDLLATIRSKLEAANSQGVEPQIATSRIDEGAAEQASNGEDADGG